MPHEPHAELGGGDDSGARRARRTPLAAMRVVALISLLFGLFGLLLLDGQVFTHAVQGIIELSAALSQSDAR